MDKATKKRIDKMTYRSMLRDWRFMPSGHPMFNMETGLYFKKVMAKKKAELADGEAVAISKSVGW